MSTVTVVIVNRPFNLLLRFGIALTACRGPGSGARGRSPDAQAPTAVSPQYDRPAFPVIDVHTHFDPEATPRIVATLDARNVRYAVNLSGGWPGHGLEEALAQARVTHGRIVPFCMLDWRGVGRPDFVENALATLDRCARLGVRGWKIAKNLGLGVTDTAGARVAVDDPRLDPLFARAGSLGMVVLIHSGDPRAFFEPPGPSNERNDELRAHPGWSFADPVYPRWSELLGEFERRVARHPGTRFIGAHFGNAAEDPDRVSRLLAQCPNYYIDTAARIPEMGRHPAAQMRRFFERWEDRIVFGTDLGMGVEPEATMLGSTGETPPGPEDITRFWRATFRYFESNDRQFEHPTPIQGRWRIDGLGLSPRVLRKVYGENAARLLNLPEFSSP